MKWGEQSFNLPFTTGVLQSLDFYSMLVDLKEFREPIEGLLFTQFVDFIELKDLIFLMALALLVFFAIYLLD